MPFSHHRAGRSVEIRVAVGFVVVRTQGPSSSQSASLYVSICHVFPFHHIRRKWTGPSDHRAQARSPGTPEFKPGTCRRMGKLRRSRNKREGCRRLGPRGYCTISYKYLLYYSPITLWSWAITEFLKMYPPTSAAFPATPAQSYQQRTEATSCVP